MKASYLSDALRSLNGRGTAIIYNADRDDGQVAKVLLRRPHYYRLNSHWWSEFQLYCTHHSSLRLQAHLHNSLSCFQLSVLPSKRKLMGSHASLPRECLVIDTKYLPTWKTRTLTSIFACSRCLYRKTGRATPLRSSCAGSAP